MDNTVRDRRLFDAAHRGPHVCVSCVWENALGEKQRTMDGMRPLHECNYATKWHNIRTKGRERSGDGELGNGDIST